MVPVIFRVPGCQDSRSEIDIFPFEGHDLRFSETGKKSDQKDVTGCAFLTGFTLGRDGLIPFWKIVLLDMPRFPDRGWWGGRGRLFVGMFSLLLLLPGVKIP